MVTIEDLRKYRVFKLAIFDIVLTMTCVLVIHSLLWYYPLDIEDKDKRTWIQYFASLILITVTFFGIGVLVHRLLGIRSAFSAYLGINK